MTSAPARFTCSAAGGELGRIALDRRDPAVRDRDGGHAAVRQFCLFEERVDLHGRCPGERCCSWHDAGRAVSRGRPVPVMGSCDQPAVGSLPCTPSTSQLMPLSSASVIDGLRRHFLRAVLVLDRTRERIELAG